MLKGFVCALVLAAAPAIAQEPAQWELGVIGGFGYAPDLTVKNSVTSASTGYANGGVIGVYGGQDMYRYWSGEANYLYRMSNLKLSGNGKSVEFGGHTHIITGDFLAHFRPTGARIRPYISFGGGIEVVQGTGTESAAQPLGNLAALTHTNEVKPVGEAGVGVKVQLTRHVRLRVQVRDFISSAPNEVITPAPGASISGIVNDIVGMGTLALTW
jgi:outer membrane protein with beta-barrel domain